MPHIQCNHCTALYLVMSKIRFLGHFLRVIDTIKYIGASLVVGITEIDVARRKKLLAIYIVRADRLIFSAAAIHHRPKASNFHFTSIIQRSSPKKAKNKTGKAFLVTLRLTRLDKPTPIPQASSGWTFHFLIIIHSSLAKGLKFPLHINHSTTFFIKKRPKPKLENPFW